MIVPSARRATAARVLVAAVALAVVLAAVAWLAVNASMTATP